MTSKPWKLILLLVGIFLVGAISGTIVGLRIPRAVPPSNPPPDKWADLHLDRIQKKMTLTPEQLREIEPIVRQRMKELGDLRAKYLEENREHRKLMEREVATKLTPEQRAIYEEHNRRFHERARRMENGERVK